MAFIQEWQADIRLSVDDVPVGDSWATYSGATLVVQNVKTRPGNMGREVDTGGPASRDDCTLTTQLTEPLAAVHPTLETKLNKRAKATITWKDKDRNPVPGSTFSVVGTFKSCDLPNSDASSGTVGMYTVVIGCDEIAAS